MEGALTSRGANGLADGNQPRTDAGGEKLFRADCLPPDLRVGQSENSAAIL